MKAVAREQAEHMQKVLDSIRERCRQIGVRQLAAQAGVDEANLAKVLNGRRRPSRAMLAKLAVSL